MPWKRELLLYITQHPDLYRFKDVILSSTPYVLEEPADLGNSASKLEKTKFDHRYVEFLKEERNLPRWKRSFVATVLSSCDDGLRQLVMSRETFCALNNADDFNVCNIFSEIVNIAIGDGSREEFKGDCNASFFSIRMLDQETVHQYTSRFNDVVAFNSSVNLTEFSDESQRTQFLKGIKMVFKLTRFYQEEGNKQGDARAGTIRILQANFIAWASFMDVENKNSPIFLQPQGRRPQSVGSTSSDGSESLQVGLFSQSSKPTQGKFHSSKPPAGRQRLKFTGPRDQGPHNNRMANEVSSGSRQSPFQHRSSNGHKVSQSGSPQSGSTQSGSHQSHWSHQSNRGQPPPVKLNQPPVQHQTIARPQGKPRSKSIFNSGWGSKEECYSAGNHSDASVLRNSSDTALDTGSTFHLVNMDVPKMLIDKPVSTGKYFTLKSITGVEEELPLVTGNHVIGSKCTLVNNAPLSILSQGQLVRDNFVMSLGDEGRIIFSPSYESPTQSTMEFALDGNLYILQSLTRVLDDGTLFSWRRGDVATYGRMEPCSHTSMIAMPDKLVHGPVGYDNSNVLQQSYLDAVSNGDPVLTLTKRELGAATEIKTLKMSLRGISDTQLKLMLQQNRISGCPHLKPRDVDNAREVFGTPDFSGALVEAPQQLQPSPLGYLRIGQECEVHADIMTLERGSQFLIAVVMPFNLIIQAALRSTTIPDLQVGFASVFDLIRSYNHTPKVLFFDLQPGVPSMQSWFLSQRVLLSLANAKTHVHRAEIKIRRLKESLRTTIQHTWAPTPKRFIPYLVQSAVRAMNYSNDSGSASESTCPAYLFGLPPLQYSNLHPFMAYGEVRAPNSTVSNSVFRSRTEPALCLAPHPSSNGVHVWLLNTKTFAIRDKFFPQPLTQWAWEQLQLLLSPEDAAGTSPSIDLWGDNSVVNKSVDDAVRGDTTGDAETQDSDGMDGGLRNYSRPLPLIPLGQPVLPSVPSILPAVEEPPKLSSKSYGPIWKDPKVEEQNQHTDWVGKGAGSFRMEEVVDDMAGKSNILPSYEVVGGKRQSMRNAKPLSKFDPSPFIEPSPNIAMLASSDNVGNKSREESMRDASKAELQQVLDKDTLTPILTPEDGTPAMKHVSERMLNLFMINTEKFTSDGRHDKFKSRWVINGNPQSSEGYDPKSLSAPTPSDCIILLFISIAAKLNWKLNVIDVAGAFLNSSLVLGSQIYARIDRKQVPLVLDFRPDWKHFVNSRGAIICRVNKGLYGLKESPSLWSIHLKDTLVNEAGYVRNPKEACIYSRGSGPSMSILIVFVDDILVLSRDDSEFEIY